MATQSPIRSPTKTQPLANRDPNTTSPSKSTSKPTFTVTDTDTDTSKMEKPDLMPHPTKQQWNKMEERRRQNVEERMLGGAGVTEEKQTYISPSDTIMSPCTAKLNAYKGKRFAKAKPQASLLSKMTAAAAAKNVDNASTSTSTSSAPSEEKDG